jgi:hypothetical protein
MNRLKLGMCVFARIWLLSSCGLNKPAARFGYGIGYTSPKPQPKYEIELPFREVAATAFIVQSYAWYRGADGSCVPVDNSTASGGL